MNIAPTTPTPPSRVLLPSSNTLSDATHRAWFFNLHDGTPLENAAALRFLLSQKVGGPVFSGLQKRLNEKLWDFFHVQLKVPAPTRGLLQFPQINPANWTPTQKSAFISALASVLSALSAQKAYRLAVQIADPRGGSRWTHMSDEEKLNYLGKAALGGAVIGQALGYGIAPLAPNANLQTSLKTAFLGVMAGAAIYGFRVDTPYAKARLQQLGNGLLTITSKLTAQFPTPTAPQKQAAAQELLKIAEEGAPGSGATLQQRDELRKLLAPMFPIGAIATISNALNGVLGGFLNDWQANKTYPLPAL